MVVRFSIMDMNDSTGRREDKTAKRRRKPLRILSEVDRYFFDRRVESLTREDVPDWLYAGVAFVDGVWIHLARQGYRGEGLTVLIEVGTDTTGAALKSAIPEALKYRDALIEHQGVPLTGANGLVDAFALAHTRGEKSYAQIARELNSMIERELKVHARYLADLENAKQRLRTPYAIVDWHSSLVMSGRAEYLSAEGKAQFVLSAFHFKKRESREAIAQAIEYLRADQDFPPEWPINTRKVVDVIEQWRHGAPRRRRR